MEEYKGLDNSFEIHVPESGAEPKTLAELAIRTKFLVTVVAISHTAKKEKSFVPRSSDVIAPGDDLVVVGKEKNARKLAEEYGWQFKDGLEVFRGKPFPDQRGHGGNRRIPAIRAHRQEHERGQFQTALRPEPGRPVQGQQTFLQRPHPRPDADGRYPAAPGAVGAVSHPEKSSPAQRPHLHHAP